MISHCASLVGFRLLVFLFIQIQQDDCFATWPILCAAVLLHRLVTPKAENNRRTDCAGNPLHPTSTGKLQVSSLFLNHSANSRSTLLCRHVYLSCDKAMAHDGKIFCSILWAPHNGQSGVSVSFHLYRFVGVGNTS